MGIHASTKAYPLRRRRRVYPLIALLAAFLIAGPGLLWSETGGRDDLFSVSFVSDTSGWACGRWGSILRTRDGGRTWLSQDSGTDYTLSGIFFVDEHTGWVVGDGGTIRHTIDGGKTWAPQESPVDYFLMGLYFADARRGWVVAERTTILHTRDGGKNWKIQFEDDDFILKSVSFCDRHHGWAVGEYGYIYHTADGGKTWEHQAGYFGFSEETGDIVGGEYLFDVVAIDPARAWVVGIDGYVAQTTDGGVTWREIEGAFRKTQLFGVTMAPNGILAVCGTAALYAGPAGGTEFTPAAADPSIRYGWLYGLAPFPGGGFLAVGKEGWVYLGSPEGTVWKRLR